MITALDLCISPISRPEFLDEWWEQRPLILQRAVTGRFSGLIDVQAVDRIVASTNLRYPYFRLFRDGQLTAVERTTTSRQLGPDVDGTLADLNAIYDHYADDGTIVLQAMERWWPPLGAFCGELAEDLGFPTQAYVYLAPPDAQGPPAHYDTHDVFVLQIAGAKAWDVWGAPTPLPMRISMDDYDPALVEAYARDTEPLHRVVLTQGQSMYIPRGYVHRARASADGSLHISVGIMVNRWIDALEVALDQALQGCQDDLQYRETLPFGRHPGRSASTAEQDTFRRLIDGLLNRLNIDDALALVHQELVHDVVPSFQGRLLDLEALDQLSANTVIRRRRGVMIRVLDDGPSLRLVSSAGSESFDGAARVAARFALSSAQLQVGNMPGGLRKEEKISLARRLVASGVFTIERPDCAGTDGYHG